MRKMETRVLAHPCEDFWLVECSECGVLGLLDDQVDTFCRAHMKRHGAEVVTG